MFEWVFNTRTVDQISNILNAFSTLFLKIFYGNSSFGKQLVDTIMGSEYLLIGVVLLIIGFVIGLLKRMINL